MPRINKYTDVSLLPERINNYEFNINRMTSFEGDTGPYLQYAHARLCSITRRAGIAHESLYDADLSLLTSVSTSSGPSHSSHAALLVRSLAQWPDVFNNTLKTLEPITVLMYLFKMTHMLSSSYDHLKIVGSEPELARARLALYESARQVLNDGMRLLGLSPVERYAAFIFFSLEPIIVRARAQPVFRISIHCRIHFPILSSLKST